MVRQSVTGTGEPLEENGIQKSYFYDPYNYPFGFINDPHNRFEKDAKGNFMVDEKGNKRPLTANLKWNMDGSFQTTRTIKEGEELLVSYGEDYWAEEAEEAKKKAEEEAENTEEKAQEIEPSSNPLEADEVIDGLIIKELFDPKELEDELTKLREIQMLTDMGEVCNDIAADTSERVLKIPLS